VTLTPTPGSPAAEGFRHPAEWEPHAATWLSWPYHREDWPDRFGPIPWVYVDFVRQLARFERVNILVRDRDTFRRARAKLDRAGTDLDNVRFFGIPTDRSWTRDYLPSFVVRGAGEAGPEVALVDWKFNGWAKYDNHRRDDRVPARLARKLGMKRFVPEVEADGMSWPVVLEGGGIDANGRGSLLLTEECFCDEVQCRNPALDRSQFEQSLSDYLGVTNVVWLGRGIAGDDTHGHVDDLARFTDERTVVTVIEPKKSDVNHEPLADNLRRLHAARDQDGRPLQVVTLPMPRPVVFEDERLPASYANFYVANGVVLVPTFNDPADRVALGLLEGLFPGREVVGIHALDLVWGLGTLHCMTHEQPAGRPVPA
jgi:agmatine deiminase